MKIRDYLEWQDDTDLDAFITRFTDDEDRVRQNIRQYVVGNRVRDGLDAMLKAVGERLDDNRDVGRYIHGAFGSGKSNLLTVLAKMLERDEMVYDLGHPALRELRAKHPWLDRHRTLVVRIHMMGKQSLVRALFDGYNAALPVGTPLLSFTDEERVFELIDKDAQRLGGLGTLLEQAASDAAFDSIPEMPRGMPGPMFVEYYHRLRRSDREKRLVLAAGLQNWRNHGASPIRPDDLWVDAQQGLDRIARHAKEWGFTAIAWLVDELVIWIRGRSRADYVNEINHLSALVDHDAARVLPFFVAVAVQMDIARTCPEDLSQKDFQDQLGFIRDRFQPQLELEDKDLYEVAAERVLARRRDLGSGERKAFEDAIDAAFQKHADAIGALSGGLAPELVRRLYPFNPALLRILVDVTQALSRNRTAIAALYRLLNQHSELEVGQFIPVGALWAFVFEPENVSYVKQNTSSKLCQRLADTHETWVRLEPKLEIVARDAGTTLHQLQQVVRTVLLCQLSDRPYFPDGRVVAERLTASTLLHLNETDIRALVARTGVSKVASWFRALNGAAPHVLVSGDTDPTVSIKIEQLDIERVLNIARAQVGHAHRFAYMRRVLTEELGLELGTSNEGTLDVLWNGTKRRGRVKVANVRTLSYAGQTNEFDVAKDEFLLVVDYPFDEEAGRSRQDDIENCQRARARGSHWTLAWLPDHLDPNEFDALTNAAAVDVIRQDPRQAYQDLSPRDADAAARMLEVYQNDRRRQLGEAVRRLFFEEGMVFGMKAALDGIDAKGLEASSALQRLAKAVLDKRYPNHPRFARRVTQAELGVVVDWVVRAAKTGVTVDLRGSELPLVDAILVPLEVAHRAPAGITRRTDGRYLAAIDTWVGTKRQFDAQDLRAALTADAEGAEKWGFGLTKDVANFFLYYLLQVAGFEAQSGERSETVHDLGDVKERFRLVKEEVVDSPTWDKARRVAERLLEHRGNADLPTPPEQAKLCRDVAKKGRELRDAVRDFDTRLRAVCTWAGLLPDDSARVRAASGLSAWLDELLSDAANASRTRRLALLHADSRLDELVRLRVALPEEASTLTKIEGQREAFEHLDAHGNDDDRTTVVVRLRNLLQDSVTVALLAERAEPWVSEAKRRYGGLVQQQRDQTDAELRARQAAEARAEAAQRAQAEAERALAEQQRKEQAERARSRTVTAPREAVVAKVQAALTEMLRENAALAEVRVRITIDPEEPTTK
ncbi:MAG: hypothetical protein JW751_20685 [Polyangiaceae bacterium]|nr:hypothetical protein [Polyangiaceae bacterium]